MLFVISITLFIFSLLSDTLLSLRYKIKTLLYSRFNYLE
nr:MAG TPA: hypothetical protein [Caudoviricetes sp.]